MHRAKEAGVPTPTIYMIDLAKSNIVMEYVQGKQIKQILNAMPMKEKTRLCHHIGKLIGCLHKNSIIHGDLTTSNMILTPHDKTIFVDFGLGEFSDEPEIRGVDLHLMKRALQSTHHKHAKECFEAVTKGYAETAGKEATARVLGKIQEIERRGRYIEER